MNADDFGLTRGVSRGHPGPRTGTVRHQPPPCSSRRSRPRAAGRGGTAGLGLGLHVNFTLGRPLTRGRSLGTARARSSATRGAAASPPAPASPQRRSRPQIARFETLVGRLPTTSNTHHHVGLYAPGARRGARRRPHVGRRGAQPGRGGAGAGPGRAPAHDRPLLRRIGPDAYVAGRTLAHLRALPPGVSEFMCHPGRFGRRSRLQRYGRQREIEMIGRGAADRARRRGGARHRAAPLRASSSGAHRGWTGNDPWPATMRQRLRRSTAIATVVVAGRPGMDPCDTRPRHGIVIDAVVSPAFEGPAFGGRRGVRDHRRPGLRRAGPAPRPPTRSSRTSSWPGTLTARSATSPRSSWSSRWTDEEQRAAVARRAQPRRRTRCPPTAGARATSG